MELSLRLKSLTIFRDLLKEELFQRAEGLFQALEQGEKAEAVAAYCAFVKCIWEGGGDLSSMVEKALLFSDNLLIRSAAREEVSAADPAWLETELDILSDLAMLSSRDLKTKLGADIPLPDYRNHPADLKALYQKTLREAKYRGYGIFSAHSMFSYDGAFRPVAHPDPQRLEDLRGYEKERKRIRDNTEMLLKGGPANNVLLYGDAGTGKSSTVKALVNEYFDRGLRLVQPSKLELLPALLDDLSENPLKFILFIDDLSLRDEDPSFTALKGTLEGGVRARPQNVAIYVTSNRRHLVKESFQSREGDEVHLNDTLQESASLSARFGMIVNFSRPEKALYLDIVRNFAAAYGLCMDAAELEKQAEAFAIRAGGRTPRAARQLVEQLLGREE